MYKVFGALLVALLFAPDASAIPVCKIPVGDPCFCASGDCPSAVGYKCCQPTGWGPCIIDQACNGTGFCGCQLGFAPNPVQFDVAVVGDLAKEHPYVAAILLTLNRKGGVGGDYVRISAFEPTFTLKDFEELEQDPAAFTKARVAGKTELEAREYEMRVVRIQDAPVAILFRPVDATDEPAVVLNFIVATEKRAEGLVHSVVSWSE
jgi:hypothetical protein